MCKQVALHGIVGLDEEFNDTQVALRVGELGNVEEDASRASTLKIRLFLFFFIYINDLNICHYCCQKSKIYKSILEDFDWQSKIKFQKYELIFY